jgi:hypothetical protein
MLASIIRPYGDISDRDILIFLTDEEMSGLKDTTIKGEIFELQDVRKVYPLELRLEMEVGNTLHGIGVYFENDKYLVSIENDLYPKLKEKSWYGTRPDTYSKIDIMTEAYAKEDEEHSRDLRFIRSNWENRYRIIEKMRREVL